MNKNNYEINVLVNGKPTREYYKDGRFFLEARANSEYSIKIKNHSHKKIMAVLSVDGVDVIKGQAAESAESGYIINPFSSVEIKGYRVDDNNVANFKFSDGKTSYATEVENNFDQKKIQEVKEGKRAAAQNNGVIGVRIWEEKESKSLREWNKYSSNNVLGGNIHYSGCLITTGSATAQLYSYNATSAPRGGKLTRSRSIYQSDNLYAGPVPEGADSLDMSSEPIASASCNFSYSRPLTDVNQFGELSAIDRIPLNEMLISKQALNRTPNFELGTAWGKQQEDKVVKVKFEKSDTYIDLEVFYLTREELIGIGIDVDNEKKVFVSGFPKAFKKDDYCKIPSNWRKQ